MKRSSQILIFQKISRFAASDADFNVVLGVLKSKLPRELLSVVGCTNPCLKASLITQNFQLFFY